MVDSSILERLAGGFIVAGLIVFFARRRGLLSTSGAAAAVVIGTVCAGAGWSWGLLLVSFFLSANVLSRFRAEMRSERIDQIIEKGNQRDAWQVLANGGVFAAAALLSMLDSSAVWLAAGAGAIAAVTADTWSTEIGTVAPESPKLVTNWKTVPPGTSGAITTVGSLAAIAGALAIALVVFVVGWGTHAAAAAIIGGIFGSVADSIAGATIQRRRWCSQCRRFTERRVHRCGTTTEARGGISWIGNDFVNVIAAFTGALAGSILAL